MDPRLPREMEQEIFETAGEIHPADIPTLLRVARRTHYWLEPLLYRHVHIELPDPDEYEYWQTDRILFNPLVVQPTLQAFFHVASTKPPSFLARGVRSVVWKHCDLEDSDPARAVITAHSRLDESTVDDGRPRDHSACSRLSVGAKSTLCDYHITHFDLTDFILLDAGAEQGLLRFLIALPVLTHLAVQLDLPGWTPDDRTMKYILDGCRGLGVLVFLMSHYEAQNLEDPDDTRIWAEMLPVRDRRIVITTYTVSWEGICPELMNYWRAADIFLEQKRLGAVPEDRFWTGDFLRPPADDPVPRLLHECMSG
ncbi:hypothetical protein C8F01DRAFT_1275364 [Mycena amicta]|nr:hypothetical protein C8F01DRAFT_1275364 [Mycena amicta]